MSGNPRLVLTYHFRRGGGGAEPLKLQLQGVFRRDCPHPQGGACRCGILIERSGIGPSSFSFFPRGRERLLDIWHGDAALVADGRYPDPRILAREVKVLPST
jgi:hypothetical protein